MRNNRSDTQLYRKYIAQLANAYRTRSDLRMFTELLLTMSAIFVFSVFAIRPTLVTIGGLTTEIDSKQDTIKTMDTKIDNIVAAQQVFANENARLELLNTAVPREPEISIFIKQIEAIANKNNTKVFSMNSGGIPITETTGDENERRITYTVTFSGAYKDLLTTLGDIENMRRPLQFGSGGISIDESSITGALFLSITGDIPFFPVTLK